MSIYRLPRFVDEMRIALGTTSRSHAAILAALPPGPYEVRWPPEQGGMFQVWGRQGTPPYDDGWAIPLVAAGVESVMRALAAHLNEIGGFE